MKTCKKKIAITLVFLVCHMFVYPCITMAKVKNKQADPLQIAGPESRLSPEINIRGSQKTNKASWVKKNKWWLLGGLSIIAVGLILSTETGDDADDGYGNISGKW